MYAALVKSHTGSLGGLCMSVREWGNQETVSNRNCLRGKGGGGGGLVTVALLHV